MSTNLSPENDTTCSNDSDVCTLKSSKEDQYAPELSHLDDTGFLLNCENRDVLLERAVARSILEARRKSTKVKIQDPQKEINNRHHRWSSGHASVYNNHHHRQQQRRQQQLVTGDYSGNKALDRKEKSEDIINEHGKSENIHSVSSDVKRKSTTALQYYPLDFSRREVNTKSTKSCDTLVSRSSNESCKLQNTTQNWSPCSDSGSRDHLVFEKRASSVGRLRPCCFSSSKIKPLTESCGNNFDRSSNHPCCQRTQYSSVRGSVPPTGPWVQQGNQGFLSCEQQPQSSSRDKPGPYIRLKPSDFIYCDHGINQYNQKTLSRLSTVRNIPTIGGALPRVPQESYPQTGQVPWDPNNQFNTPWQQPLLQPSWQNPYQIPPGQNIPSQNTAGQMNVSFPYQGPNGAPFQPNITQGSPMMNLQPNMPGSYPPTAYTGQNLPLYGQFRQEEKCPFPPGHPCEVFYKPPPGFEGKQQGNMSGTFPGPTGFQNQQMTPGQGGQYMAPGQSSLGPNQQYMAPGQLFMAPNQQYLDQQNMGQPMMGQTGQNPMQNQYEQFLGQGMPGQFQPGVSPAYAAQAQQPSAYDEIPAPFKSESCGRYIYFYKPNDRPVIVYQPYEEEEEEEEEEESEDEFEEEEEEEEESEEESIDDTISVENRSDQRTMKQLMVESAASLAGF